MKTMKTIDKTIASFGFLAYVLWLGGSIIRMITAFDLFIPGTLELKQYSIEVQTHIVRLFEVASPYTNISYAIMLISLIYLFIKFKRSIKINGWMFMSMAMLLLTVIPNSYLIYLDYKLAVELNWNNAMFDSAAVTEYFMVRFTKLSVLEPLVLFSGFTSAVIFVCRPLNNVIKPIDEN